MSEWTMRPKTYESVAAAKDLPRTKLSGLSWISMRNTAAVFLLLAAILVPRLAALDRLVTPDENRWLARSANFYYALTQGEFKDTYQIEHPGVLTMWSGMLAFLTHYPKYKDQAPGQVEWWRDELGPILKHHGQDPLMLLVAARGNMVILIALILLLAFRSASQLFGFWPAITGFLLIALDPFHVALSRLLHVDGLPSSLALLSLLAFLGYLYRGQQKLDLAVSGAAAGLAWLTKSPMLFLIPFVGLLLLISLIDTWKSKRRLSRSDLWNALLLFIGWGSIGLAVFVLLWPSMWVDPLHTLRRMLGGMLMYADQGHDSLLFFNGQLYEGDPGVNFYPITYLWRTTPVILMGLILAALALVFPQWKWVTIEQRRSLGSLLLFAILYTVFMTLGAKKFDRYLLPVYPPLDLLAGAGWFAAFQWVRRLQPVRSIQVSAAILLLGVLAVQVAGTLSSYPYYLTYYNPLLGGIRRAPDVMMIGWGEGLDQAARFLNSQPDAAHQQVVTGVWSTTFSYYYHGPVLPGRFEPGASVEDWNNSDYYVLYINEQQRGKIPAELAQYLATLSPVEVVRINGLDYVYIYDIRDVPPPDYLSSAAERRIVLSLVCGDACALHS